VKRTGGAQEVTGAESVKKVFKLMLSFTVERPLLTVADLAAELGFPKSSVYRYVALLRELGMLEETSDGLHRVTLRLLPLARAALAAASTDPTQVAHGFIERVAAETGETTLLMQRVAHHVVAVDIVESPHAVRLAFERGTPMTLHTAANGADHPLGPRTYRPTGSSIASQRKAGSRATDKSRKASGGFRRWSATGPVR
jgi:hypothetical protein